MHISGLRRQAPKDPFTLTYFVVYCTTLCFSERVEPDARLLFDEINIKDSNKRLKLGSLKNTSFFKLPISGLRYSANFEKYHVCSMKNF